MAAAIKSTISATKTLGLCIGKNNYDFNELYKDVPWFKLDIIFNPVEIVKEEFFKKEILKPEEDYDAEGYKNKGGYIVNPNFRVAIVATGARLDEI